MVSVSKIIGMKRASADEDFVEHIDGDQAFAFGETIEASATENAESQLLDQSWEYTEDHEPAESTITWTSWIAPTLLTMLFLGWAAFYGWTYRFEITPNISAERATALLVNWAIPAILIGIVWLLLQRSSRAEAKRFGQTATLLRNESEALETRMRTVNEEISLAREFLAQNALELENIGRHSAARLNDSANQLSAALADSDEKAKKLEQVSSAAASNLENLRKHLPVVTSAAKDVTNQIGNAGNTAQVHAKSLIAALQRVSAAGDQVRSNIDDMHDHAANAAININEIIGQNAAALSDQLQRSEATTNAITTQLSTVTENAMSTVANTTAQLSATLLDSGQQLVSQSELATQKIDTLIKDSNAQMEAQTNVLVEKIETIVGESGQRLSQHSAEIGAAISSMRTETEAQDLFIEFMIRRVREHIETVGSKIEEIDQNATDRSTTLAFSFQALAASSADLDTRFAENGSNVEHLIERSERLLLALDSAAREIDETLPAAFGRVEALYGKSLQILEAARQQSADFEQQSDDLLAKTSTISDLVAKQGAAIELLLSSKDGLFDEKQKQFESLSEALSTTRDMLNRVEESANGELLQSLENIKVNAQQAALESREIVDNELASVSERLSEQNRQLLARAVDDQVKSLNGIIQESIGRSLRVSDSTTAQLAQQLAQINEMTGHLEQRLSLAHESFGGIDEGSFARQMALLTESLNSTAIDVAKILSNEVTDTSWAAYLKGDRGVFTRRAVRLLDGGEARAIATHYGEDPEFRDHVNRYIHDFESMMRVLLSTRDGNSFGVTVLSSDVGKLYVALAQAIERLRD